MLEKLPRGDLLLGYQQRTIDRLFSGVSLLVIEKSRRIGLTWGLASYAALSAAAQAAAGGQSVWYMGYNLDMAREFIDTVAMWARAFGIAADAQDEEILETEGNEKVQAFRIRFASGFKVVALPSMARALRGMQGIVIIDEAAFHTDLAEVLKAAMALLIWGGQVIIVSTHDGIANPFNLLLDDVRAKRRKGEALTITFKDAIEAGLYERVAMATKLKHRQILEKDAWIQDIRDAYGEDAEEELDCIPKAGAGSWLDPAALAACEHPDAGRPELYSGGLMYGGYDVARRRDGAVIHGYELVGDVLWMRDRWFERGATFKAQTAEMDRLFKERRMAQFWIDQTGMGEKVVEDAQGTHGNYRVHGVLMTGPNRLDLAISLKQRVEACKIRIPPLADLRTDWRAIKKRGGVTGSVTLVNDGEVHADEFWAGALASRAADLPETLYEFHTAPRQDRFSGPSGDRGDARGWSAHDDSDRPQWSSIGGALRDGRGTF